MGRTRNCRSSAILRWCGCCLPGARFSRCQPAAWPRRSLHSPHTACRSALAVSYAPNQIASRGRYVVCVPSLSLCIHLKHIAHNFHVLSSCHLPWAHGAGEPISHFGIAESSVILTFLAGGVLSSIVTCRPMIILRSRGRWGRLLLGSARRPWHCAARSSSLSDSCHPCLATV